MENPADKEPTRVSVFGSTVEGENRDRNYTSETSGKQARRDARSARRQAHREWRRDYHHHNPASGLVWLAAGIILLCNTLGIIPWVFWNSVWQFWPVLIILVGLKILLGSNSLARALMLLITLATLGYVISYALFAIDSPLSQYVPQDLQSFIRPTPSGPSL